MKNILTSLAKSVLVPLGLTAAASATDAAIQRKIYGSVMTVFILSSQEMDDIVKVVKFLQESGLLTKDVNETIKNKAKEQKGKFIIMLLDTLGASLLGNMLARKGVTRAGKGIVRAGEGTIIL